MLTDIAMKKAKAKEKPYKLGDSGGLYLWVTPSGGKLWRWTYRHEGKQKLMTLGKYPHVPLALARERHGSGRTLLATGADPMFERKAARTAELVESENSFTKVSARWLEHWQDGKSPRHVDQTRRRLASNILSSLGSL